jgi:hypothetical protein
MAHNEYCLRPGETLKATEWLRSKNGLFHAVMQEDSNLVVYRGDWKNTGYNTGMWSVIMNTPKEARKAGAGPYYITMQADGNLVIAGHGGLPLWALSG